MKKLALLLAIMTSPLCAETYLSIGAGPYIMIPNIGIGYLEDVEIGKLDLNANLSFSNITTIFEAKASFRLLYEDYYFGPSIHINHFKADRFKSETNTGAGIVLGKDFHDSFVELSLQEDIFSSKYFNAVPNLKVRYGVKY